jgi:hypothetical protein
VIWKTGSPPAAGRASPPAAPGELTMSYAITVVRHGARWLVLSIGASATRPWPVP